MKIDEFKEKYSKRIKLFEKYNYTPALLDNKITKSFYHWLIERKEYKTKSKTELMIICEEKTNRSATWGGKITKNFKYWCKSKRT